MHSVVRIIGITFPCVWIWRTFFTCFYVEMQLRKMLDLLVHASQCRSSLCQYPNCRKVKGLFRHGIQCKTRASRGCVLCKKMWYLLQLHARACKEAVCHVPRCRLDAKAFLVKICLKQSAVCFFVFIAGEFLCVWLFLALIYYHCMCFS